MTENKVTKRIKIPCQKKLHRKQCLLSEDAEQNQNSTPTDEGNIFL